MSNFFIRPMKLTGDSEDAFTECPAETLQSDRKLAGAFLEKLCGPEVDGTDILRGRIVVDTQVPFDGSVPDMVFRVDGSPELNLCNRARRKWRPCESR